jgi:hypothetical protein
MDGAFWNMKWLIKMSEWSCLSLINSLLMNILIKSVVEINRLQLKSLGFYISHVEYQKNYKFITSVFWFTPTNIQSYYTETIPMEWKIFVMQHFETDLQPILDHTIQPLERGPPGSLFRAFVGHRHYFVIFFVSYTMYINLKMKCTRQNASFRAIIHICRPYAQCLMWLMDNLALGGGGNHYRGP